MKKLITLCVGIAISTTAFAKFPVDNDIADLRQQISYLETLKDLFSENDCRFSEDDNTILLRPDWLRSEGLVIAIDKSFAGNVFSYHRAPKPKLFRRVVEATSHKPSVSPSLIGIYGGFGEDLSKSITFYVSKPTTVAGTDGLIVYGRLYLDLKVPQNGSFEEVEVTSKSGTKFRITCNK